MKAYFVVDKASTLTQATYPLFSIAVNLPK